MVSKRKIPSRSSGKALTKKSPAKKPVQTASRNKPVATVKKTPLKKIPAKSNPKIQSEVAEKKIIEVGTEAELLNSKHEEEDVSKEELNELLGNEEIIGDDREVEPCIDEYDPVVFQKEFSEPIPSINLNTEDFEVDWSNPEYSTQETDQTNEECNAENPLEGETTKSKKVIALSIGMLVLLIASLFLIVLPDSRKVQLANWIWKEEDAPESNTDFWGSIPISENEKTKLEGDFALIQTLEQDSIPEKLENSNEHGLRQEQMGFSGNNPTRFISENSEYSLNANSPLKLVNSPESFDGNLFDRRETIQEDIQGNFPQVNFDEIGNNFQFNPSGNSKSDGEDSNLPTGKFLAGPVNDLNPTIAEHGSLETPQSSLQQMDWNFNSYDLGLLGQILGEVQKLKSQVEVLTKTLGLYEPHSEQYQSKAGIHSSFQEKIPEIGWINTKNEEGFIDPLLSVSNGYEMPEVASIIIPEIPPTPELIEENAEEYSAIQNTKNYPELKEFEILPRPLMLVDPATKDADTPLIIESKQGNSLEILRNAKVGEVVEGFGRVVSIRVDENGQLIILDNGVVFLN